MKCFICVSFLGAPVNAVKVSSEWDSYVSTNYEKAPLSSEFETVQTHDGRSYPLIGLGGCSGVRTDNFKVALQLGYRLIDTAAAYRWGYHEDEVGEALKWWDGPRNELWVQTKVDPEDLGTQATWRSFNRSQTRLGKVDSILIHKPRCWSGSCSKEPEGDWKQTWRVFEELYRRGDVQSIGICDVDESLFSELLTFAEIKPHVIQNYMDPYHQDHRMRQLCKDHGIVYQGYSTLGNQWVHFSTRGWNPVLDDPVLARIASRYGASVPEVVLRWALQQGVSTLPASTNKQHLASNYAVGRRERPTLKLTLSDLAEVESLDGKQPVRQP